MRSVGVVFMIYVTLILAGLGCAVALGLLGH
jgi:hypothetical protein